MGHEDMYSTVHYSDISFSKIPRAQGLVMVLRVRRYRAVSFVEVSRYMMGSSFLECEVDNGRLWEG